MGYARDAAGHPTCLVLSVLSALSVLCCLYMCLQVFLNMQDRLLAQRGKSAWAKDYYMPAPCDGLVATGR